MEMNVKDGLSCFAADVSGKIGIRMFNARNYKTDICVLQLDMPKNVGLSAFRRPGVGSLSQI